MTQIPEACDGVRRRIRRPSQRQDRFDLLSTGFLSELEVGIPRRPNIAGERSMIAHGVHQFETLRASDCTVSRLFLSQIDRRPILPGARCETVQQRGDRRGCCLIFLPVPSGRSPPIHRVIAADGRLFSATSGK